MDGIVLQLAQLFERVCGDVEGLARESGAIVRQRGITGSQLVQTLLFSWWLNPQATWEEMAANALVWFDVEITHQSLHEHLGPELVGLLVSLARLVFQQPLAQTPQAAPILSRFSAVLAHDATTITLPKGLSSLFPGCGHQQGESAAMKFLVQFEILTGQLTALDFDSARTADTVLGARLPTPPAGSLILCDRGFFDLRALPTWSDAGAYFLMRPITGVTVARAEGPAPAELQPLGAFLRSLPRQQTHCDLPVVLTAERFPCRLIAVRAPEAVAARRRQKAYETARRKGRTPGQDQLTLCDWFVLITNLPPEQLSVEEALVVYRVRWQIELLFKCYKSESGLARSRARTLWPRLVELAAKWLARLLEHQLLHPTGGPLCGISWTRRVRRLRSWLNRLLSCLNDTLQLTHLLTRLLNALAKLPRRRRRRKHPGTRDLLENPKLALQSLT